MPMNVRIDGPVAVLSNFGRLFDDPRYIDASREVRRLIDEGMRRFVIDLTNLRDLSDTALGLLTTITRQIRQGDGEVVLAHITREVGTYLEEMRMDDYWDVHKTVDEAVRALRGPSDTEDPQP